MKFSIRDLLLVSVTAAVGTAWGVDHWKLMTQLENQAAAWKDDHLKLTAQLEKQAGGLFRKARIKITNGPPLGPHGVVSTPPEKSGK